MNKVFYNPSNKISELTYIESVFLKSCAKVLSIEKRQRVYSYYILDKVMHHVKNIKCVKNGRVSLADITIRLEPQSCRYVYDKSILQNKISRTPTPDECTIFWSWYMTFSYKGINFKSSPNGLNLLSETLFTSAYDYLELPYAKLAF